MEESMTIRIIRWAGAGQPSEQEIRRILTAEGLSPYSWSNGPGDVYAPHVHSYDKVIYVVRGSITFEMLDTGEEATLHAGDRLDFSKGVVHGAVVGPQGVVCLEAHRG